jgi:hypothetical protein
MAATTEKENNMKVRTIVAAGRGTRADRRASEATLVAFTAV